MPQKKRFITYLFLQSQTQSTLITTFPPLGFYTCAGLLHECLQGCKPHRAAGSLRVAALKPPRGQPRELQQFPFFAAWTHAEPSRASRATPGVKLLQHRHTQNHPSLPELPLG